MDQNQLDYYVGRLKVWGRETVQGKVTYHGVPITPHEVRAFGQQVEALGQFFLANPKLHHKGGYLKFENARGGKAVYGGACLVGLREHTRYFHVPALPGTRDLNTDQFTDMAFASGLVALNDSELTAKEIAKMFVRIGKTIQAWASGEMTEASLANLLKKRFPKANLAVSK